MLRQQTVLRGCRPGLENDPCFSLTLAADLSFFRFLVKPSELPCRRQYPVKDFYRFNCSDDFSRKKGNRSNNSVIILWNVFLMRKTQKSTWKDAE
ncbi:MAG: hypothetical protein LBU34_00390 [Planctomycetaceae bacterium]|nr:hypothetical protein [Planctomycetaceae bacterium]